MTCHSHSAVSCGEELEMILSTGRRSGGKNQLSDVSAFSYQGPYRGIYNIQT